MHAGVRCLVVAAIVVAGAPTLAAASQKDGAHEGLWNRSTLVDWVADIGGKESRYDELASVRRFGELQRAIEEVKQMVLHDARNEQEAIEGLRMILKHLASSTKDSLDADFMDPLRAKRDPRFRDIGAYNPDAEYDQAFIDGRYDYELSGKLGSVPYLSITVNGSREGRLSQLVGYLDDAEIRKHARPDGSFTLWLTKTKPRKPGAWLHLPDEANGVVIRQYVADRERDTLASFSIRAIGGRLPDVERTTDEEMALRFSNTTDYLVVSSTWHRTLLPQMRETPNTFVSSHSTAIGASAANRENYYQMAYYELGEDEALLVDVDPPDTVYWNLTSATIWHESHRYLSDPVSLTSSEVAKREDGTVRVVLARRDPGHPNWIKTFGHDRGFLILRIVGVEKHALPSVRKVSTSQLAEQLAADTPAPARAIESRPR